MTGTYYTEAANWMRSVGLTVVETGVCSGWKSRARSSGGFSSTPLGIQWHHTASQASPESDLNWMINGSGDAPIGNCLIDRDGVIYMIAGGAANTAGKGGPITFSRGTVPLDSGNTRTWAFEVANSGVGEKWPQVQIDAYFAASNIMNKKFGNKPTDIMTHNGYCEPSCPGRKIDPATAAAVQGPWKPRSINSSGTWNQQDVRDECNRRAGSTPPPDPTPPSGGGKYTVVSGDSWWSISQKYGITVDQLLALNPPATSSTVIHPGDVINVPGGSSGGGGGTYTVVSGDSWYGIANKLGCTPEALVAANPPATMNTMLHPGDVLNVPGGSSGGGTPKAPNGLTAQQNQQQGGAATTPPSSPTLKKGVTHNNVPWLQQVLCSMPKLAADGGGPIFDPLKVGTQPFGTADETALKYWQSKNGLTVDGVYGSSTANKMLKVRGK